MTGSGAGGCVVTGPVDTDATADLAAIERDWIAARFLSPDGWGSRDTGLSSDGLICWALDRCTWDDVRWPMDRADFGRCIRATQSAPAHLRERMEDGLERFRVGLFMAGVKGIPGQAVAEWEWPS